MRQIIAIRREDLDKKGEKRVAIDPELAAHITKAGYTLLVQPASHPATRKIKRAFKDEDYQVAGASITEDISEANIIFGLKEVNKADILKDKVYLFFSHTHKGQLKNRELLQKMVDQNITLIDYELIRNQEGQRLITAFTYMAGYAGMIDSLWALRKKWNKMGIYSPLESIPQAIEYGNLEKVKEIVKECGLEIIQHGTPESQPPLITAFLGNGRTSQGAQEIYDLLPVKEISLKDIPSVFEQGDRKFVYKWVADIPELYRLKKESSYHATEMNRDELIQHYLQEPQEYESNMDSIFPYCTIWMNCIIWSPKYPRLITRKQTAHLYGQHQTLQVIGDITCDPEGAIEFSRETWIDDPVFTYHPEKHTTTEGFHERGIAVMAVTNLPCEFSTDASRQFSKDIEPYIMDIIRMDLQADTPQKSGLPPEIAGAVLLWKGAFTPDYQYMKEYIGE